MRDLAILLLRAALSAVLGWYLLARPIAAVSELFGLGGAAHGGWVPVLVWPCIAVVFWLLGFISWFRSGRRAVSPEQPK